jgi:membrane protein
MGVTASLQSSGLVQALIALEPFGSLILFILRLIPYLTVWGAFTFLYIFVPNTKVRIKSAMLGALVGALLWQTVGWGFAAFVAASTKYYAIYSGFAILLLFLLWIYYGWMILLFGAQVAFAHQNFRLYERERKPHIVSGAGRERIALNAMALIGQSFYLQQPACTAAYLARQVRVSSALMDDIVSALKEGPLIIEAEKDRVLFPARDPEQIGLKEIIDAVRTHGDRHADVLSREAKEDPVAEVMRAVDTSLETTLQGRTLKSLVLEFSRGKAAKNSVLESSIRNR